jgi:uncharacterized protein YdiU (UPF0061 family)
VSDVDTWYQEALADRDRLRAELAKVTEERDVIAQDRVEYRREIKAMTAERDAAVQRAESENVRRVHAEADAVARIAAWLDRWRAECAENDDHEEARTLMDARNGVLAGAWRGKEAP